jgi:hypothetical protein
MVMTWHDDLRALRRAAAVLLCAALAGCASLERNPNVPGTFSDKLSTYNYKEEGQLAVVVVGVGGARFIRDEPFFPLFVQVVNKSNRDYEVSRESFLIEDSFGRQYAMAPAAEVAATYRRADLDRRLFRQNRSVTSTYVTLYTFVTSNFFPLNSGRTLRTERVSLPPRTYTEDVIYFPIPETGLNGVPLRLLFKVKALEEPIQVVFEVPRTLGILEKEDAQ